ncbi:TetR/AcrR family transcriptional regulator [Quadrisphaera sp. KR29]|uniref:TetR/AcrR family transcriptional regulator n=1 Tax=Quadrisphaera sp. KR29 TaxID=3461391 RepID=UPI004044695E
MSTSRGGSTRAALIRATTELVGEVGYHHATTKAIAERAGVAEGTIYRHFPDKRALFAAAVMEGQREVAAWMDALPARAGSAPLADVLAEVFVQLSVLREQVIPLENAMAATPALAQPAGSGLPEPDRTAADLDPASLGEALAERGGPPLALAEYLRAEQELGTLRADVDPAQTAVLLLAAFYGLQTSPLAGSAGLSAAQVRDFVDVVLHGLAHPAGRQVRTS